MGELLDKRLKAVSSEAAFISDAIRYRYLRSAEGSIFMTFIAPHVGRGKHFDKALDKHMQRKPAPPLPDNAEVSGLSTRPPGYRADVDGEKQ